MKNSILSLVFLLLISTLCQAQEAAPLRLQAVSLSAEAVAALSNRTEKATTWQNYTFQGETYFVVQFQTLLSAAERKTWKAKGLRFIQYLPEHAYLVALPSQMSPSDLPFPIVFPLLGSFKLTRDCAAQINRNGARGTTDIAIRPMPGVSAETLLPSLPSGFRPVKGNSMQLEGSASVEGIKEIAENPGVWIIETAEVEPFPEGFSSGAIMGAAVLHSLGANHLTGENVVIGIADDGNVYHKDLKNRLILDLTNDFGTSHGEMTTSIAAGAGNLFPEAQGLAPAAKIHLTFILDYLHHNSAVENYNQYKVTITSTSYGDGCGGFYNTRAAELDHQIRQHPVLMHCFSAGNEGGGTCSEVYALLEFEMARPFANLTGGRKAAKNAITVGNVDTDGILAPGSSVGPAEDGRLKPDVVAVGQNALANGPGHSYVKAGGTSAAAPAVAGILALLTEAYRQLHGGQDPPSALLKGALLNGARDLGRPGPDFEHGWGLADAHAATEMINNNQYFPTKLSHGSERTFNIHIPEGTETAKIMLVWHDAAGAPIADKALVNDLDLRVLGPEGQLYYPMVLSSFPHPDSLTAIAKPGVDRLNNAEQVVIATPTPGNYTVKIKGFLVPEGPQSAFVVYRFEESRLVIRHPAASTAVAPGDVLKVVWDKGGTGELLTMSYRQVGAVNWTPVATGISGHNWLYNWTVPMLLSGTFEIQLSNGQETATSEAFTILPKPGFFITQSGLQQAAMHWAPVEEATLYEVYALGDQYMEVIGTTNETSFEFPVTQGTGNWFSVRARMGSQAIGPRARAQFYRQSACNNQGLLKLHLDDKPEETTWSLVDEAGMELMVAGPYPGYMAGEVLEVPLCLPDGCFTLSVQDSGNDGLCCEDGAGKYELFNQLGHKLAEGSHFGGNGTAYFCMESNQPTLQAFATAAATVSCNGAADGWAVAYPSGGTGVYSFAWSNGTTTQEIEDLSAGTYGVTISDQVSSVTSSVVIAEPAPLGVVVATEDSGCGTVSTGMVRAMVSGGAAPYQFYWSTGATAQELQQIPAGSYGVTVYDSQGCSVSTAAQVLDASPLALYLAGDMPTCSDTQNGAAFASVIGGYPPYQYDWSNGSQFSTATALGAGTYQLTVTDVLGCTATGQIELEGPTPIGADITYADSLNYLEVSVYGGFPPYSFQWSDGSTTSTLSVSESEVYQLTITDANGCQKMLSENVSSEAPEHCAPTVNTNAYNWIDAILLDTFYQQTGQNEAPFSSLEAEEENLISVRAGQPYLMSLFAGFQGGTIPVYWRVWVDLNEDGDFEDEEEQLFHSGQQSIDVLSFQFQLPSETAAGLKTMRVSQSFLAPPDPCGVSLYGETEDYRLRVIGPVEYCASTGQSTSQEWLEAVQIGTLEHTSGNDGGYGDHTGISMSAQPGAVLPVVLTPGYAGSPLVEFWSVWADFNRDGIYNHDNELVFQSGPAVGPVNGSIELPASTTPGPLYVRVQMRWNGLLNPCDAFSWGEVEDYQLMIEPLSGLRAAGQPPLPLSDQKVATQLKEGIKVWPVPAQQTLNYAIVQEVEGEVEAILFDGLGRQAIRSIQRGQAGLGQYDLNLTNIVPRFYQLLVRTPGKTHLKSIIVE
jgi:hypothetical protein